MHHPKPVAAVLLFLLTLSGPSIRTASAHFPWLVLDSERRPRVFFGEGLADQDYHLPKAVEQAEVWQTDIDAPKRKVAIAKHEEEGFVGLRASDPIDVRGRLQSTVVYGVYHGAKLNYYAQCYPSRDAAAWPQSPAKALGLQALLAVRDESLVVTVMRDGGPAPGVPVTLTNDQNKESLKADTDKQGRIEYPLSQIADGRNALMAMVVDKQSRGEINGEPFQSTTHILTVTIPGRPVVSKPASALPRLPEAVASFGAAAADGWLYVYSGHIGVAHDHSRDNLSKHFRRTKLDGSTGWEELPMQQPLQGLAMVAHGGSIYRVGGLDARNASEEEDDLHSVDSFARYDPAKKAWADMPPLPSGRSSHNAVVIGDTLYVVGGWRLTGPGDGDWRPDALAFDLRRPDGVWRVLPEPPFRRRAFAIGHADGKLVVMGGMTDDGDLSTEVFLYDPGQGSWTKGQTFPGEPFPDGFGLAAWNEGGALYAGGMGGVVYRLSPNHQEWLSVGKLATPRLFHQFAPNGRGGILAIAGAASKVGHLTEIEDVKL